MKFSQCQHCGEENCPILEGGYGDSPLSESSWHSITKNKYKMQVININTPVVSRGNYQFPCKSISHILQLLSKIYLFII